MESNDKKTNENSMDLKTEHKEKLSFHQKVLQKLSFNRILRKIPFVDKLLTKQLKALPEGSRRKNNKQKRMSYVKLI